MKQEIIWKAGDCARLTRGWGEGELCTLTEDPFFNWVLVEHEDGLLMPRSLGSLEPIDPAS